MAISWVKPPAEALDVASVRSEMLGLAKAPVAPQAHVVAPSGGLTSDSEARTAINGIRNVLVAFGLMNAS